MSQNDCQKLVSFLFKLCYADGGMPYEPTMSQINWNQNIEMEGVQVQKYKHLFKFSNLVAVLWNDEIPLEHKE